MRGSFLVCDHEHRPPAVRIGTCIPLRSPGYSLLKAILVRIHLQIRLEIASSAWFFYGEQKMLVRWLIFQSEGTG